ncbi:MAG: hypothetical protein HY906_18195, partial [Deltaproteobacteria bacterium]|nr:hypothetical protein [Deltaproteobacteria bacterium]
MIRFRHIAIWSGLLVAVGCGPGGSVSGDHDAATGDASPAEAGADRAGPDGSGDAPSDGTTDGPGAEAGAEGGPADAGPDAVEHDDSGCVVVTAAADVDAWAMRPPAAGFGGILEQTSGGHTDVFLKSPTDLIRIGARLDWGGTVVYFGLPATANSNVIDANDTGRELQIALYDPTRAMQNCAWNASCQSGGTPCANSITYLGWDPVQGGDECGHGAAVVSHGQVGDALEVLVRPLQWNPDWNATDCRNSACGASGVPVQVLFRMQFRFVREHVVEVMTEVVSEESISHPVTGQEFPTLYVAHGSGGPDLPLLLDASGTVHPLNTPGNDGFYYDNFTSSASWVTWQNSAQNYGVGLAHDQGLRDFQGWRGDGSTAPYFHNVRAQIAFGLPAGGSVRGISYLALGSFATVKSEIEAALAARGPFGVVDAPAAGAVHHHGGSPVTVAGWVLDTSHLASVTVQVDGATVATLPV